MSDELEAQGEGQAPPTVDLNADDPGAALRPIAHPKKNAFLRAYSVVGNITAAAKAAGISPRSHHLWMADESLDGEAYRDAFALAKLAALESLEQEAWRRARMGVKRVRQHFYQGKKVGETEETVYSDTLLIFLLKALDPEKYRERSSVELTGASGGPIRVDKRSVNVNVNSPVDADSLLAELVAELDAQTKARALDALSFESGLGSESH